MTHCVLGQTYPLEPLSSGLCGPACPFQHAPTNAQEPLLPRLNGLLLHPSISVAPPVRSSHSSRRLSRCCRRPFGPAAATRHVPPSLPATPSVLSSFLCIILFAKPSPCRIWACATRQLPSLRVHLISANLMQPNCQQLDNPTSVNVMSRTNGFQFRSDTRGRGIFGEWAKCRGVDIESVVQTTRSGGICSAALVAGKGYSYHNEA